MKRRDILTELGITEHLRLFSYYNIVENSVIHSEAELGFVVWIVFFFGFLFVTYIGLLTVRTYLQTRGE